ncbi:MAG: histidine-type phosphatase [Betaproteobacteria bacterium]
MHRCLRVLAIVVPLTLCAPAFAQGQETLQRVVIVSRHGVRTPTVAPAVLAGWSNDAWPGWKDPIGNLTSRGALLATQMGRYYRQYLAAQGAMPAEGCPAPGSVYIDADVVERTKATAQALIEGLSGGACGIAYRTRGDVDVDGLYHPLAAGVCKIDPMVAQTQVLERVAGDLNTLTREFKAPFDALQSVIGCCKPAVCTAYGKGERCALPDLPTMMSPRIDGSGIALLGALAIADTASELLLLEYADGKPTDEVGWGRATVEKMQQTLRLHTEAMDLMQRTPYLARKMGSALLLRVAQAVASERSSSLGQAESAVRDAKFVAYVGHDTNIFNLAGMLDASWLQPGYQRNQTPPAGALMFEIKARSDGTQLVYTSYVAQSLEQMRNVVPLSLDVPPVKTPLRLPGCSAAAPGFACTMDAFAAAVTKVLDRDCVQ